MSEICKWAETDSAKRNFKEGKQDLRAGHIIKCGLIAPRLRLGLDLLRTLSLVTQ